MKTRIKKWGINGEGIAFVNKRPVFIPGAIVGEEVEWEPKRDRKTYVEGILKEVIEPSARRRHELCPHASECGGCSLMHLDYKGQVRMKEEVLKEALHKYAGYDGPILPLLKNPSPLAYRNACKMPLSKVDGKWSSGMYKRDSNDFVSIDRCIIHSKVLEQVRNEIDHLLSKPQFEGIEGLKTLVLKEFDKKVYVVFVTEEISLLDNFVEAIMDIDSVAGVWQSVKTEQDNEYDVFGSSMIHLAGQEKMDLTLGDLHLKLLPRSFFQLNTAQAKQMYEIVQDWLPRKCSLLVEAYSGVGAISLYAANQADRIVGIESIEDAVLNANENAQINQKDNVQFVCQDAAEGLKEIQSQQPVDVLVVDPPRTGLGSEMIDAILSSKIHTIVYVSCNPSTLAKDIKMLDKKYRIIKVQPVDIFSQTPNIESICLLKEKTGDEKAQSKTTQPFPLKKRTSKEFKGKRHPSSKGSSYKKKTSSHHKKDQFKKGVSKIRSSVKTKSSH